MLEPHIPELRRCAACHVQCQFATLETFAAGSMAFDTSRKASMLIALAEGKLELSDRVVEVIYSGLSSGIQHSVCVYSGDPKGWPDEALWLRRAREAVVAEGKAPAWAAKVRDGILQASTKAEQTPIEAGSAVHLRGSVSSAVDPAGREQLSRIASTSGSSMGQLDGEAGFELYDLGYLDDAKSVAGALSLRLDAMEADVVVADSPEVAWMIRAVWPDWSLAVRPRVLHVSEWLDELGLGSRDSAARDVALHDAASLVRGLGVLEAPRRVLRRLGFDVHEFVRSGREVLPAGSYYGPNQGAWIEELPRRTLASAARLGLGEIIVLSPYDLRSLKGRGVTVTTLHGAVAGVVPPE